MRGIAILLLVVVSLVQAQKMPIRAQQYRMTETKTKFRILDMYFGSQDTNSYEVLVQRGLSEGSFEMKGNENLTWCSVGHCEAMIAYLNNGIGGNCTPEDYELKVKVIKKQDTMVLLLVNIPATRFQLRAESFEKGTFQLDMTEERRMLIHNAADSGKLSENCIGLNTWVFKKWEYQPDKVKKRQHPKLFVWNWRTQQAREQRCSPFWGIVREFRESQTNSYPFRQLPSPANQERLLAVRDWAKYKISEDARN